MQPPLVPDAMAILRSRRGLLSQVARSLDVTRAVIVRWERVPAERLPAVEASTGLPRWVLRPDICLPPAEPQWVEDVLRLINTWEISIPKIAAADPERREREVA